MSEPELVALGSNGERIPLTRNPDGTWSGQVTGSPVVLVGLSRTDGGEIVQLEVAHPVEDAAVTMTVWDSATGDVVDPE